MSATVEVIKLNIDCKETWRYTGRVIERTPHSVLLEARFNREDRMFQGILLGRGDRFVEIFFSDRWYNIFEMHDRTDDHLKGWYCNVSFPAVFEEGQVSYIDLALDLLVYPDGRQLVLDEDEFAALSLDASVREQAVNAMTALQALFQQPGGYHLT